MSDQNASISATQGNVYAPPEARVDDVVPDGELQLADRSTRLVAAILDGIILWILNMLAMIPLGLNMFSPDAKPPSFSSIILMTLIGLFMYLAVNGYLLARDGQTVGKKLMKIRILRSDGEKATFGRLIGLRLLPLWLVNLIPLIGGICALADVLFIFRDSRKCLHDNIADTVVVKVA